MKDKDLQINRLNPFSFAPAYVGALSDKIQNKPNAFRPRAGGRQFSVRIDLLMEEHIKALEKLSGWNKSEIIYAFLQRGIFDLYETVEPETTQKIINNIAIPLYGYEKETAT